MPLLATVDSARRLGLSVLCTQGALGEWFTLIAGSASRAREFRRRGVRVGAPLGWADLRGELRRVGLRDADIDAVVAQARRSATTISVPPRWLTRLRRLFG